MKKLPLPLLAILIGLSSCSEDFEVAAPYKQITVVYGLLDVRNPAQYIRIQKAFMDENKSAVVMAREADSSYYRNLVVQMREISGNNVTTFPVLDRVNLANEGFPKEPGSFFTDTSFAYKTTQPIRPGRRYRLVITNTATGRVDSAETDVIDSARAGLRVIQLDLQTRPLNFFSSLGVFKLDFDNSFPSEAKMVDATVRFHVINRNVNTGVENRDSFDYIFARIDSTDQDFPDLVTASSSFYSFLAGAIGPAPGGIERILDSADLFFHVGTRDMLRYQILNGLTGGLTGDQVRPIYTNIRSAEGSALGLFAARTMRAILNVPIDKVVVDSLRANPQTTSLNIVGVR